MNISDISVEELSAQELTKNYRIRVAAEQIAPRIEAELKKLAATVEIKGFRKGKVPIDQVKRRYGASVAEDVARAVVLETSRQVVEDKSLDMIGQPSIRLESEIAKLLAGEALSYQMTVELAPQFTPIALEAIALERITTDLNDSHVSEALSALAERHVIFEKESAERAAQDKDMVVIDISGTIDGKPFANNESKDVRVQLGENQISEPIDKALIGKSAGDQFNVPMGFPQNHPNKILAGQLADFSVAVKAVHAPRAAQIDEVFAQAMGAKNVEALRQSMREEMARADRETARAGMRQQISEIMLKHEFTSPPNLIRQEQEMMLAQIKAMYDQLPPAERAKTDMSKVERNIKVMAEKRVRVALVLSRIARDHDIRVEQGELKAAIEAEIRRHPDQAEQIKKIYAERPEMAQRLYAQMIEEKTIDHIIKLAKITDTHVSRAELYKPKAEDAADKQSLTDLSA